MQSNVLVAFLRFPLVFEFSVGIGVFVIGQSQIFFFCLAWHHSDYDKERRSALLGVCSCMPLSNPVDFDSFRYVIVFA